MRIRRKVVDVRNYIDSHANGTGGSNALSLECGHITDRKCSQGIPKTVFCRECEDWANGFTAYKSCGETVETWDAINQMPVFTRLQPGSDADIEQHGQTTNDNNC